MNYFLNKEDYIIVLKLFLILLPLAALITLIHESGHWLWAYFLGLDPILHYGNVTYNNIPESVLYSTGLREKFFLAAIGGPVQNMVIGSVALTGLIFRAKRSPLEFPLSGMEWALVLLTLLWARQIYVGFFGALSLIFDFEYKADEVWIATYLNWPVWSLYIPLGLLGSAVGLLVLYYFPEKYRIHFVIGGGLGAFAGMGLWYVVLGPVLLP